jgi:glutamate carboxypeptidase
MEQSEGSLALLKAYGLGATAEGLGAEEAPLLGGGSDACTTAAMGIASLDGLGPRGKGFHTEDEQIEVRTLVPKAAALVRFLAAWPAVLAGRPGEGN